MNLLYLADIRFPMERANGIQTIETCHALARRGVAVTLAVQRSDGRTEAECLEFFGLEPHDNLALVRLAVRSPGTTLGRIGFVASALSLILRPGWDVVYTRDLLLARLLVRRRRLHRARVAAELHTVASVFAAERASMYGSLEPPSERKLARLDARERRVCRDADGVVTITDALRQALEQRHAPMAPVAVIPDGCRLDVDVSPPPETEGPKSVLYAGQLYPWKGVDALVRAMALVPEAAATLDVVGGLPPEPDLERVKTLVSELGLDRRVRMLGYVPPPEVARARRGAHIVVVPLLDTTTGRLFTSPLKLFEAMASGRAVVASDLPSIREVLTDEVNALLVPPGDVKALAAAIARLSEDDALAARLGEKACRDAAAYSWERRAEHLEEFLARQALAA